MPFLTTPAHRNQGRWVMAGCANIGAEQAKNLAEVHATVD